LQRISASDFRNRDGGEIFWSLFTNAKGRIIDLALASLQENELLLLAGEGHGKTLRSWIESFVITEDVQLMNGRDALSPSGSEADEGARKLLEAGQREAEETRNELEAIQSFRFRPGIDLDERFHPLEVGLERVVGWDKGCYIGQEVVARLKNYDKVRRAPAVLSAAPAARSTGELRGEKRVRGELVRTALQSDPPRRIGLAVVDRELQRGAVLYDEDDAEWQLVGRPEGAS
jgi:folate-binding protein YgfZ